MPLVVPGINSGGDDKNSQWMNKLMGKKLGDDHDQTVRCVLPSFLLISLTLLPGTRLDVGDKGDRTCDPQTIPAAMVECRAVRPSCCVSVFHTRRDMSSQTTYGNLANPSSPPPDIRKEGLTQGAPRYRVGRLWYVIQE